MRQKLAEKLLKQTQQVYNAIAYDFSNTRSQMWQDLLPLLDYSRKGDKVLDLGCGNGRLFGALKEKQVDYIGCDNSSELLKIAQDKYPEAKFYLTDGLSLPFQNETFDIIYCIAVLHHIPSRKLRDQFLQEAKRVLKPHGLFVATVWKLNQKKSLKLILKFSLLKIIGENKMDFGDVLVPWRNQATRFVHNFTKRGLKKLLNQAGFQIEKSGILLRPERKNANIFVVAKALKN